MLRSTFLTLSCTAALAALIGLPNPRTSAAPVQALKSGTVPALASRSASASTSASASARESAQASAGAALAEALGGAARICKPGGPWGAHLQPLSLGPGDVVTLDVVFKPLLPNEGLRWSLELPAGTQLLAGRKAGELVGTLGLEVRETLSLRLPAGLDAGSVSLDVTPLHDTRLSSSRELDFGVAPVVGSAQLFVADTGATSALLVLPSSTREGR